MFGSKKQNAGDNSKQYVADNGSSITVNENYPRSQNSREILTIIDLIDYISNNAKLNSENFEKIVPDPNKKIYIRFANHCKELEKEIQNYAMYGNAIKEAENAIGTDLITTSKRRGFLMQMSNRKLRDNENNPIKALDSLTDYFENILRESSLNYDYNAIRFYLISEIPKCNIFPNYNE